MLCDYFKGGNLNKKEIKMRLINLRRVVIMLSFTLLSAQFSYGQTKEKKINAIIDRLEIRNKTDLIERLEYLNSQAAEEDRVSLIELENLLADREIRKAIVQEFDEYFTDKEIDELHKIANSDVFKKLSNSSLYNSYSKLYKYIEEVLDALDRNIQNRKIYEYTPDETDLTLIPVEREDGFYATIDYDLNNGMQDLVLEETPSITKEDILDVKKEFENGYPYISVTLNEEGTKKFHLLTQENVGKPIAIVIDKHIVVSPTVQAPITGGKIQITGRFSEEEIDQMINKLKDSIKYFGI